MAIFLTVASPTPVPGTDLLVDPDKNPAWQNNPFSHGHLRVVIDALKLEHPFPAHPADIGITGPGDIEFALVCLVQNPAQVLGQLILGGLYD
jgi:hypothetical protein